MTSGVKDNIAKIILPDFGKKWSEPRTKKHILNFIEGYFKKVIVLIGLWYHGAMGVVSYAKNLGPLWHAYNNNIRSVILATTYFC